MEAHRQPENRLKGLLRHPGGTSWARSRAKPHRIKAAAHRHATRTTGHSVYANDNPVRFTDPTGRCVDADFGCGAQGRAIAANPDAYAGAGPYAAVAVGIMAAGPLAGVAIEAAIANPATATAIINGTAEALAGDALGGASLTAGAAVAAKEAVPLLTSSRVPNAGGKIVSFVTEKAQTYFRVFSGDNKTGSFLTAVKPSSRAFAKESLALPPGNNADFIQQVLIPGGTRLQRSRALPAFGHRGGAEQFELLERIPNENFGQGVPLQ